MGADIFGIFHLVRWFSNCFLYDFKAKTLTFCLPLNTIRGGLSYGLTEFVRRVVSESLGTAAAGLEVPIILFASAMGAFFGSFVISPFESVRIRTLSQPNYASNIFGVLQRMVQEEGLITLYNSVPAFLLKEIPFAMAKFTLYDVSTAWLFFQFPAAKEDLQLSLLVSLLGGTLGGIGAAVRCICRSPLVFNSKTHLRPFSYNRLSATLLT
jgi:hypothetical protein